MVGDYRREVGTNESSNKYKYTIFQNENHDQEEVTKACLQRSSMGVFHVF